MTLNRTLPHGAIVACEYGLPAALKVRNTTKVTHTDPLLAVDGYVGTVRLLDS